jgi:hypothetical protein
VASRADSVEAAVCSCRLVAWATGSSSYRRRGGARRLAAESTSQSSGETDSPAPDRPSERRRQRQPLSREKSIRPKKSLTRGEGKRRSVGEAAPTQSVGARGIENSSSERGGTSDTRRAAAAGDFVEAATASGEAEEAELRELQAQLAIETVKRQARAGPMADAIRDLLASSPEAMEVLKPFLPRGP